jgi:hypothetical protein
MQLRIPIRDLQKLIYILIKKLIEKIYPQTDALAEKKARRYGLSI